MRKDFLSVLESFNSENLKKEQLLFSQMPFLKNITSSNTKDALLNYFKQVSSSRGKCLT